MVRKAYIFVFLFFFGAVAPGLAQERDQYWLDFQVDYPFGNKYLFETTASYQTIFSENKWRSLSIAPVFEDNLLRWFTLVAVTPITFTLQKEGNNTFDFSPSIGGKFFISQGKRVEARFILKEEQRFFHQKETGEWETSNRIRAKAEVWVSLNGPNFFTDHLWYLISDYEEFIVLDQQVDERFANLRRARLGVGYRLSYTHRFEVIYTWQQSRDEIYGVFQNTDNIVQLRYKMYLNAPKVN